MNFLKALNKQPGEFTELNKKNEITNEQIEISNEENFLNNMKDSVLTNVLSEVDKLCDEFIEETLTKKRPLLIKHHTGYENFKIKILNLMQENIEIELTDLAIDSSDSEDEFDSIDYLYANDEFH